MMTSTLKALIAAAAVLYGAEALADNSPSDLSTADRATLEGLIPEDMASKFTLHDEPREFRDKTFQNAKGDEIDLHTFDGGVTLVNFWATWCPPCLAELPGMEKLQVEMGDDGLTIVPISLDRGGLKKAGGFWKKAGFEAMAVFADPDKDLAQQMGVLGLPVSAILGPDGREIGRVVGDAEWDSEVSQKMLGFLIEATGVKKDPDTQETALEAAQSEG